MATLGDIASTVANDILKRPDEAIGICQKAAKRAYQSICNKVAFPELRVRSDEITVSAATVNLATEITDYDVAGIISIRYTSGSRVFRLSKLGADASPNDWIDFDTVTGTPSQYCRVNGTTIELNVTPSLSTDTMRVYFWQKPRISASDIAGHTLLIPEEWEELLEMETLRRSYIYLQELEKATSMMVGDMAAMPGTNKRHVKSLGIIPSLWNDLLTTVTDRESIDENWGMQPYRREM